MTDETRAKVYGTRSSVVRLYMLFRVDDEQGRWWMMAAIGHV